MARYAGYRITALARSLGGIALAVGLLAAQVAASHHAVEFGHDGHSHDEQGPCEFPLVSAEIFLLPLTLQDREPSLNELPAITDSLPVATRTWRANRIRAPPTYT